MNRYCFAPVARVALVLAGSIVGASSLPVGSVWGEQADEVIDIWPETPPGPARDVGAEQDFTKDSDALIAGRRIIKLGNVATPQAHVYLPPENLRTGASVVICPGGGFHILAWDLEGTEVAQWLNTLGVAGIVLKYRVPSHDIDPRWQPAAQDTQRAISLVRQRAAEWKLDAEKVAALGFSAGGMAVIKAALAKQRLYEPVDAADDLSWAPNRIVLIYSAGLPNSPEEAPRFQEEVTDEAPPVFAVHAFDDFVPVQGVARMLLAWKQAGVPAELHVFDTGGHGYGLRTQADLPVTTWPRACEDWLRRAEWVDVR